MKRIIYICLITIMMWSMMSGFQCAVMAAEKENEIQQITETETETEIETEIIPEVLPPKAKKAGWLTSGEYRYYFKTAKKMVTGFQKINGKIYYFREQSEGFAPKGSMVTGFYTVSDRTYYFSKTGKLQTGWKKLNGKYYYFRPDGKLRTIGMMYTGLQKVNGKLYLFGEQGNVLTGWQDYEENRYYLNKSKVPGERGAITTGWQTIGKYRYYFDAHGIMQKNCWIIMKQKYYVDDKGHKLTSCVTPDGYIVNEFGARVKAAKGWIRQDGNYYYYVKRTKVTGWKKINKKLYYFDADGVRQNGLVEVDGSTYYFKKGVLQTGWQRVNGKKYYFDADGKMLFDTTVDGITLGADGVADGKISVLLIAGHGMNDPGATSQIDGKTYYEKKYTRQFADLIDQYLKELAADQISVTMYDQNYDCYQVNRAYQQRDEVIGPLPDWQAYDYILEIHFNATVEAAKDLKGNGTIKGVGMYVFPQKSDISIDKKIISAISKTGMPVWGRGTGVFSQELLNARTCYEAGVPYSLLETAFIDDKDDMKFYKKNKKNMAKAVAKAIGEYFN